MLKKYLFYLIRWQLSTPILAVVLYLLGNADKTLAAVVANFIGGLIFFWIDRIIFKTTAKNPLWEIEDNVVCHDCGKTGRGYRIAEWLGYNRLQDPKPQFRCDVCKDRKFSEVSRRVHK